MPDSMAFGVFIANYSIDNSPSLINLIDLLSRSGWVDVYLLRMNHTTNAVLSHKTVRVLDYSRTPGALAAHRRLAEGYDAYIGVDPQGFVMCTELFPQAHPVYYSLELYMSYDHAGLDYPKAVREKERVRIQEAAGLIIQSEEKARLFRNDYALADSVPTFILPVTYRGAADGQKSDLIRRRYGISADRSIALHLGGIAPWFSCAEIAAVFSGLSDWVLFFQGYPDKDYALELQKVLAKKGVDNVILTDRVYDSLEAVDSVVRSCDVGIAWYNDISIGFRTAGQSSGKIPGYMRFGLPVIAKTYPSTRAAIAESGAGLCVDNYLQIPRALAMIRADYTGFSRRAMTAYERTYRFENYEAQLLAFILRQHTAPVEVARTLSPETRLQDDARQVEVLDSDPCIRNQAAEFVGKQFSLTQCSAKFSELIQERIAEKKNSSITDLKKSLTSLSLLETQSPALDKLIPPEIKNDKFYDMIEKIAAEEPVRNILEIGSASGDGSTAAFVDGLKKNPHHPTLFCLEISQPRFVELQKRYANLPFVKCHHASSVGLDKFPGENDIVQFYESHSTKLNQYPLDRILNWYWQDVSYLQKSDVPAEGIRKIKVENNIEHFDMVLIDGSEFTGQAELDEVYGAKIILLDDVSGFKNFHNYRRLINDPNYGLVDQDLALRNGYAIFKRHQDMLPIHFFTIVLNGRAFMPYHIDLFNQLSVPWHWHIIEGVADLKHDTAWSLPFGGRITDELHDNGLSCDGTTEYIDTLAGKYPDHITIYRKANGQFWDGKLEMVNAPLANLKQECLLWQVDVDELWTVEQIQTMRGLFEKRSDRTAAFFHCHFFVGPQLVTITPGTYSHHNSYEWLRVWRYKPGMRWASHEPPRLVEFRDGEWKDLAKLRPFTHDETAAEGLVFTHYAYTLESQLKFKETYYGYEGALEKWRSLQSAPDYPVLLRDYFTWVEDDTQVDQVERRVIGKHVNPVAFDLNTLKQPKIYAGKSIKHMVIDGVIFQLQAKRPLGISRVWQNLIPELVKRYPGQKITLLERRGFPTGIENVQHHEIPPYILGKDDQLADDDDMLGRVCRDLNADVFLSTYFTHAAGIRNVLVVHDLIPEKLGLDLSRPEWRAKTRAIANADVFITVSNSTRNDLIQIYPDIAAEKILVAHNGVAPAFYPATQEEIEEFNRTHDICHPYFLLVGNRGQYKNCAPFFQAFTQLKMQLQLQIIAVGGTAGFLPHEAPFGGKINIKFIPWLSDDELRAAYSGALSLIYLSRYEGFGLPVLEAMACGCPVITNRNSALVEVGDNAVWYADPDSPAEIEKHLDAVLDPGLRKPMIDKGIERARKFTWPEMARKVGNLITAEKSQPKEYLVSAIVSTYNAERFIRGCLEDLLSQTIADRLEIIVVDSGSEQKEAVLVREFQKHSDNIKYIRCQTRETVYAAWNRGIQIASGKYITNANTDDRHRKDTFEVMANVLEAKPDVALVYADVLKTDTENETFEQCHPVGEFRWYDWDRNILLKEGCFIGPQPMWRRCVHDVYGWFDENLVTSGDYEFWLRISQSFDFYHIRMPLGLYLARPDSIEHRDIKAKRLEDFKIRSAYLDAAARGITIRNIKRLPSNPMIADTIRKNHKTTGSENTAKTPPGYRLNQIKSQLVNQGGIDVKDYEVIYQAFQPLFRSSRIEDALAALENFVNSCPTLARAHHDLGSIYYQKNEKEKALAQFELASRIEPQNTVFKKSLADFYYVEQNRIEEALRLYNEIVAVEPVEPETLLTAGHLCVALERFDEARKNYERVLEVEPDNLDARQYLEKMQRTEKPSPHATISEKGQSAVLEPLNENLSRQDIDELEQKIRINPDDALAHNDLGVLYYRAGEKEKALKHYEQSAKLAPANIVFQKNLADFYFVEKGMIEEALKIYVNVLTIEPEDTETLQITGQICMSLHNFEDAKVFFKRVLEIEPWNFEAQELLDKLQALGQESIEEKTPDKIYREIHSEMEGEDPRTVIEALEKLAAAAPEFALAHNDLGVLYYQSGEKEKALTHYERAARLEPENATFQKNLADFYFVEQGRVEDALKIYVDLLAAYPEDIETLLITGHICVSLRKFDDAKVFYSKVLELEPWNADARQNLAKLDGYREAV